MFSQDFKEFIELLIKHKAEYLIVGGYAVGIHDHPSYTGGLDIWLNPSLQNAALILKSVNEFAFSSYGLLNPILLNQEMLFNWVIPRS